MNFIHHGIMEKLLFLSDYCEGAHPQIIDALASTNMVQTPGYGEDVYCARARELVREACGRPDADVHFLVGGTQTNVTFIASVLRPHQGVLCAHSGHINVHETGAVEHSGHKVLGLPHRDGKISAAQITEAVRSHYEDPSFEHTVQPGMVYISFPTELGTIYTRDELFAISDACHEAGIPLFVDGARLGYGLTCSRCDVTLQDIAKAADAFYIGGTKQGALFGEAVVIGNDGLKKDFRYAIKQNGGMLAKGRLLGLQFLTLFGKQDEGECLYFSIARHANSLAARIRAAFEAAGCDFLVDSPTNQQFPVLTVERIAALEERFGFETWQKMDDGRVAVRFCTSWATGESAVEALEKAVSEL